MNLDNLETEGTEYDSMEEAIAATCGTDLLAIELDGRFFVREPSDDEREMIAKLIDQSVA